MRRLAPHEAELLSLIAQAGGSMCPGADAAIPAAAHKVLRRLVTRGDLTVAEYDDGPVYTLTAQGRSDAS